MQLFTSAALATTIWSRLSSGLPLEGASETTNVNLERRAVGDPATCTPEQVQIIARGMSNCAKLASSAYYAAKSGDEQLFYKFFRTKEQSHRDEVAARFGAIARECAAGSSGKIQILCGEPDGLTWCETNRPVSDSSLKIAAYALGHGNPSDPRLVLCPLFWDTSREAVEPTCSGFDHGTLFLHDLSHMDAVYSPSTEDYKDAYGYNVYGIDSWKRLDPPLKTLTHADSYSLYAAWNYNKCQGTSADPEARGGNTSGTQNYQPGQRYTYPPTQPYSYPRTQPYSPWGGYYHYTYPQK